MSTKHNHIKLYFDDINSYKEYLNLVKGVGINHLYFNKKDKLIIIKYSDFYNLLTA